MEGVHTHCACAEVHVELHSLPGSHLKSKPLARQKHDATG